MNTVSTSRVGKAQRAHGQTAPQYSDRPAAKWVHVGQRKSISVNWADKPRRHAARYPLYLATLLVEP